MMLNKKILNYPTHTLFNDKLLNTLATYVVVVSKDVKLDELKVRHQFEFLTRAVHITVNDYDTFVRDREFIRTRFTSIIREYKIGWFRKSGIAWLGRSDALEFKLISERQPFLHYRLTDELLEHLIKNKEDYEI